MQRLVKISISLGIALFGTQMVSSQEVDFPGGNSESDFLPPGLDPNDKAHPETWVP
jgi:hypothetical protein